MNQGSSPKGKDTSLMDLPSITAVICSMSVLSIVVLSSVVSQESTEIQSEGMNHIRDPFLGPYFSFLWSLWSLVRPQGKRALCYGPCHSFMIQRFLQRQGPDVKEIHRSSMVDITAVSSFRDQRFFAAGQPLEICCLLSTSRAWKRRSYYRSAVILSLFGREA